MFKHTLAIDIADKIPNFAALIATYSHETLVVKSIDELDTTKLSNVEAVLISIHQQLSEDLLKNMPKVHHVFILGTSLKKIPLRYCQEHNIKVSNITEYCDHETAEWVILQILKHFRETAKPRSVGKAKLGVVGVGAVGKIVLHMAQAFDMEVTSNSDSIHPDLVKQGIAHLSKEAIFSLCDVISIHTPPNISWLTKDLLESAKPNLLLLNTCMGRVAPGNDLQEALNIRADITLVMDSIAASSYPELTNRALVIDQPAFKTLDSQERLIEKFFANIKNAA